MGILKNPFYRFLITAVLLFAGWSVLYNLWLDPIDVIDRPVIDNLIYLASLMLEAVGYDTIPAQDPSVTTRIAGIDGTTGVWVGDPCNGVTLFAIFLIFVLSYPGQWRKRLWFIPLGLLSIHILNAMRIAALSLIQKYAPGWLEFNHTYTFTILVYAWVFYLWYIWASRLNRRPKNPTPVNA